MIIGFDGSRAFGTKRTGTENYSYQILKHLAQIDHKNKYIVYLRPNGKEPKESEESKVKGHLTQHVVRDSFDSRDWPSNFQFKVLPFPRLWTQAGLAKQTFIDKLDVLFVPSHTLPLIRRPGLKTVMTVHDLGAEYLPQTHQLKQRLYLNLMTHYQLKSATHLIAVSKATKSDIMKKIGISEDRISVIYEGFNSHLFHHPVIPAFSSVIPAKAGIHEHSSRLRTKKDTQINVLKQYDIDGKPYFLFVGTIQPRKNIERLIRAYAQYRGFRVQGLGDSQKVNKNTKPDTLDAIPSLVLAGGKGWLSEDLYKLPQALGIGQQVKFLGYVPDEHLPTLYRYAEAFLFPSLFEGFGLPVLEAFACHCPVLTSNSSSLPEVAGQGAILVDPYSVEAIAEGIEKISEKQVQRKLVRAGETQLKKFSWKQAAIETRKILEKTLSLKDTK